VPELPPAVFGLLGHPVRWGLVRALARSDLRVGELVSEVGERQNLVSYHLGQLRQTRLVVERRSSADRRDVYYTLDLARLGAELDRSASALHPALGLVSALGFSHPGVEPRSRVLFLCTGNSARSQIAEAILRSLSQGTTEVQSAGPRPAGVHPYALRVLDSLGLSTDGLRSKGVEDVIGIDFDHVVTLCDVAREECPELPGDPSRIHWSLPDPAAVAGPEPNRLRAFQRIASELKARIAFALPVLAKPRSRAA
jgi:protein-tyrosine-phosphatase/DNA-binding transcriptional ArsR family regulator